MKQIIIPSFITITIIALVIFVSIKIANWITYSQSYTSVVYEDENQTCIEKKNANSNEIIKYCLTKDK